MAAQELITLVAIQMKNGNVRLDEDAIEMTPMFQKSARINYYGEKPRYETFLDPLRDVRDVYQCIDPVTGNTETLLISNPKYKRNKIPSAVLNTEDIGVLWAMAEILSQMARGAKVSTHLWKTDCTGIPTKETTPHSNPPEGKSLSKESYYYWKRRRLLKKKINESS